jgi:DNA repair photolyase
MVLSNCDILPIDHEEQTFYSAAMHARRPIHRELPCKQALDRVSGMSFRWSLNPYRGCAHACHYCYARATHPHLGLNAGDDFSGIIFVKPDLPKVLRRELSARSWKRECVVIGTVTDPYQPCEGRYRITRQALAALISAHTAASVTTKSTLVIRDLDLLREQAALPGAGVNMTITTLDRDLARFLEPAVPPPVQRLRAIERLAAAGVHVTLFAAPVIPGLTDDEDALDALAGAAREAGARSFWAGPLGLEPMVREHWLAALDGFDPALAVRHAAIYRRANGPVAWRERILEQNVRIRERHGFVRREFAPPPAPLPPGPPAPTQLALFA